MPYLHEDYGNIALTSEIKEYLIGQNIGFYFISESTALYATVDCWVWVKNAKSFLIAEVPLNKEVRTSIIRAKKADGQPDGMLHIWAEGNIKK